MNYISIDGNYITKVIFSKYDDFSYLITIKAFKKETEKIIKMIENFGFNSVIKFQLSNFPPAAILDEFDNEYYIYAGEFKHSMGDRGSSGAGAKAGTLAAHDVIELYCLKVDLTKIKEMRESLIKNYMAPFLNFFYHKMKFSKTTDENYIFSSENFFINKLLNCKIKQIIADDNRIFDINDCISEVVI